MSFKDIIKQDIGNVFFNKDEFADEHIIDGVKMNATIDQNELIERNKKVNEHMDGIYSCAFILYVTKEEFGNRPKVGSSLKVDGKQYKVIDCTEEDGVYAITLGANRA